MKGIFPVLLTAGLLLGTGGGTVASDALPETGLSYQIQIRVDPASRRFEGHETIHWRNPSEKKISSVPLHLYLNAFSNKASTWLSEAKSSGFGRFDLDRFYKLFDDPWGWIEPGEILQRPPAGKIQDPRPTQVEWQPIQPDDGNVFDRSLIRLSLPEPVPPGRELRLEVEFSGRLPAPFARTGCIEGFCFVGQWYPKLAVLETPGVRGATTTRWAARQFHAATEFYADFADYDVIIETPEGWTVGATGHREEEPIPAEDRFTRHRFVQRAVHDFAFMLGEHFEDVAANYTPAGRDTPVQVHYLIPAAETHRIPRWRRDAEAALDTLGEKVGPYPYRTLSIVFPPYGAHRTEGMEYPTLFVADATGPALDHWPMNRLYMADRTLIHEFVHQYFYGLLASNEQEEAFLDEGFTNYWEDRAARVQFGTSTSIGSFLSRPGEMRDVLRIWLRATRDRIREPLRHQPSALFETKTHAVQFYSHAALILATAEGLFGTDAIDSVFSAYYREFRFRHPGAEDFLASARKAAGLEMEAFLREALSQGRLPDFEITSLKARRYDPPEGSIPVSGGRILITRKNGKDHRDLLELPMTEDAEGKIWLQVTDPGWFREGRMEYGTVRWEPFEPAPLAARIVETEGAGDAAESGQPPPLFESTVRISGPAWDHLPVDVILRFADGREVRDHWDGKAPWRAYRALRPSKLVEVRVDPDNGILLDVDPANNGRRLEADERLESDWSAWLASVSQWLAGGLSLWL